LENVNHQQPASKQQIKILKNGPYLVLGRIPLYPMTIRCNGNTIPVEWEIGKKVQTPENYSLCRCGQSKNKPFCDGTHIRVGFNGTETSDNEPFEKIAKEFDGPDLELMDAEILCASARFCHRGGDIWQQISLSDDPEIKQNVVRNAFDCPSGRLVVIDKKLGKTLEPPLEKSIGFTMDPGMGVEGPLWVRGGIPIYSADGNLYQTRNRVTLCRCGKSTNKPFCDSSHYPEEDREVIANEQK
jgi:CDGSH-type Zn-finger protein